jgi:hypothetical protein
MGNKPNYSVIVGVASAKDDNDYDDDDDNKNNNRKRVSKLCFNGAGAMPPWPP